MKQGILQYFLDIILVMQYGII